MKHYLDQAKKEYVGTPDATAFVVDKVSGARYALVRMRRDNNTHYVLAWIGAELASSPDEGELDDLGDLRPRWQKLKPETQGNKQ